VRMSAAAGVLCLVRLGCMRSAVQCEYGGVLRPDGTCTGWEGHGPRSTLLEGCQLDCAATGLPRVTDRDWNNAEIERFVRRAGEGVVAVNRRENGRLNLLASCNLDGRYVEIRAKAGSGAMWASTRPLFRADEVGESCAEATHLVAAYARQGGRFDAILLPLPCPSVLATDSARGCVGRGMTGAQRLKRARALWGALDHEAFVNEWSEGWVGRSHEARALVPDHGLSNVLEAGDRTLSEHAWWVRSAYGYINESLPMRLEHPEAPKPQLNLQCRHGCIAFPVFMKCFPDIFEPELTDVGCWIAAHPEQEQGLQEKDD
jgi:hypothetical protein